MFHIRTLCGSDSASHTFALRLQRIEALVHFLPGPEERDRFLFDRHSGAGGWAAAAIGAPLARRKYPEAAEFDPVSPAQCGLDRAQHRVDEILDITLAEMGTQAPENQSVAEFLRYPVRAVFGP